MSEKLKPCAFCSADDAALSFREAKGGFGAVVCLSCGAIGPKQRGAFGAMSAWNRRHQEQETSSEFERMMK